MKQNRLPLGWDEKRIKEILTHYESQTEQQAVAEDESAFGVVDHPLTEIPGEPAAKAQ